MRPARGGGERAQSWWAWGLPRTDAPRRCSQPCFSTVTPPPPSITRYRTVRCPGPSSRSSALPVPRTPPIDSNFRLSSPASRASTPCLPPSSPACRQPSAAPSSACWTSTSPRARTFCPALALLPARQQLRRRRAAGLLLRRLLPLGRRPFPLAPMPSVCASLHRWRTAPLGWPTASPACAPPSRLRGRRRRAPRLMQRCAAGDCLRCTMLRLAQYAPSDTLVCSRTLSRP